jgi:hypothetical protein
VAAAVAGPASRSASPGAVQHGPLSFERDIRPILKANCFDCHGESEKPKGGLDLRLQHFMVKGGESGAAIVPGDPQHGTLLEKVRKGEMPKREKKLTAQEIATLEKWIAQGARTARSEPADLPRGMTITEEERAHWSFQPIRRPTVPATRRSERARTPVDAFLLPALRERHLAFAPDADKVTLLRRLHLDLLGLPPSPEDTERFLADSSSEAYEHEVDRLLAMPQYGERWGRHWLDVAGYADSDGYTADDTPRDYAYKYRDYVIRAFNADKPFDQFVVEQLAGDELVNPPYRNLDPTQLDKLIATGFLRMGPDGTGSASDQDAARNQVVADTVKIVSISLLGLTVGCAQCHDHRYDPIPQVDYHRLRAVLEPAYDWKHWKSPRERLLSLYTDADRTKASEVESEAAKVSQERADKERRFLKEALEKELEKFPEAQRPVLREAYETPEAKRTEAQKVLLKENPSVNISGGTLYQYNAKAADELKAMDARIGEIRGRKPAEDFISILTEEPGNVPVTYRFHRGDPRQPKEPVRPGGLSVLDPSGRAVEFAEKDPALATTGRRLAFARWVASTNNPLFARVIVNRVWMDHFGRGLVRTPGDFGSMGERPSNPELLDWLASEFASQGWSLKRLHRLLVTSTVYRQASSRAEPGGERKGSRGGTVRFARGEAADPDDRLYWRKPVVRLDAEAIRDSLLAVSGALNPKMFGPPVPVRTDVTGQVVVGIDKTEGDNKMPVDVPLNGEEFRRSVYIQVRRSRPLAMLNAFDAPVMEVNCEKRQSSTVAPQALMLMNSGFILDLADRFADRLRKEAGTADRRAQITRAWRLAFTRPPTPGELARAERFLDTQAAAVAAVAGPPPASGGKDPKAAPRPDPEQQALRSLCQVLLSANEVLYVD